ncbi:MAG TPA: aminoglycoside 6'-N-acetyltransferase [Pyrinomonadaceae bacterium]|jgi:aminoglycoside 6'-N-acetyltransferase I|nr:aminoglycoside 6'-N-acetyltransferase [Pyrinomonadaceae bacterium]
MSEFRYSVRPLREPDLNEWLRLRKQLWDATSDADHRSEMVEIINHPDSQFVLVAEHESGRLIGFLEVSIRPFVEDCHTDHVGYLEGWYVEPDVRGRGIGRELVRIAENWASEKGCEEMASDAEIGNELSLLVHKGLGYNETSRLVHLRKELK